MSLLRLLPTLRAPILRRSCIQTISSSASHSSHASVDRIEFFDDLVDEAGSAVQPAESNQATTSTSATSEAPVEQEVDNGPPVAPPDSYPRNPPSQNPMRGIKSQGMDESVQKPLYAVSVKSSRNNTIITFARPKGNPLVTLTGGKLGFKKSNRNGYEAGYQCAVGIINAMEAELKRNDFDWELYLKGFGQGREAMLTAITTSVGAEVKMKLKRITDRTPMKIGGTRGMKTRRV